MQNLWYFVFKRYFYHSFWFFLKKYMNNFRWVKNLLTFNCLAGNSQSAILIIIIIMNVFTTQDIKHPFDTCAMITYEWKMKHVPLHLLCDCALYTCVTLCVYVCVSILFIIRAFYYDNMSKINVLYCVALSLYVYVCANGSASGE